MIEISEHIGITPSSENKEEGGNPRRAGDTGVVNWRVERRCCACGYGQSNNTSNYRN